MFFTQVKQAVDKAITTIVFFNLYFCSNGTGNYSRLLFEH